MRPTEETSVLEENEAIDWRKLVIWQADTDEFAVDIKHSGIRLLVDTH